MITTKVGKNALSFRSSHYKEIGKSKNVYFAICML